MCEMKSKGEAAVFEVPMRLPAPCDWLLHRGEVVPNDPARRLRMRYCLVMDEMHLSDACEVGANLVALFMELPWLASFRINVWVSLEKDEGGGFYRDVMLGVDDLQWVVDVAPPSDRSPAAVIDARISDFRFTVRDALFDDDDHSCRAYPLSRSAIELLLHKLASEGGPLSRREAFSLLFPDDLPWTATA